MVRREWTDCFMPTNDNPLVQICPCLPVPTCPDFSGISREVLGIVNR